MEILEKLKEFMRSPKKTAILGLVSSILMILSVFLNNRTVMFWTIVTNFISFGFAFYFIIILLRLVKNVGNIKIANYFLIISFAIVILADVVLLIKFKVNINIIIYLVVNIYMAYYLYNLLIKRNYKINNKIFSIILIGFIAYQMIYKIYSKNLIILAYSNFTQNLIVNIICFIIRIAYIGIIPYFTIYSKLLNERGK